jgi:hypothetical protein
MMIVFRELTCSFFSSPFSWKASSTCSTCTCTPHSEKTRRRNAQPQCWSTQAQSAARLLTWPPVLYLGLRMALLSRMRCCCCCYRIPLPEESRRTRPPHRARGAAHQLRCTLHHKYAGTHALEQQAIVSTKEPRAINWDGKTKPASIYPRRDVAQVWLRCGSCADAPSQRAKSGRSSGAMCSYWILKPTTCRPSYHAWSR